MLKRSFLSRVRTYLTFNKGKEELITCMQGGNVSLLKTAGINCWWETAATGPCYHNRSLMRKLAPWEEEKREHFTWITGKVSRRLLPRPLHWCNGHFKLLEHLSSCYLPALHQRLPRYLTISSQRWTLSLPVIHPCTLHFLHESIRDS